MKFDFDGYIESMKQSSMDYWFPLTKNLRVPQPVTEAVLTVGTNSWLEFIEAPASFRDQVKKLVTTALTFGYPLFIRTDQASAKHRYIGTCMVECEDRLLQNIFNLIEENLLCDLNVQTLYFREFIKLDSLFTAFNKLPIAPERRYFVTDGEVVCHHPYWPEAAIRTPSDPDWKRQLKVLNHEDPCEIERLTEHAEVIGSKFSGSWSVDFAKGKDGIWYFIDMADARTSWHPKDCENYKKLSFETPERLAPVNVELEWIGDGEEGGKA